MALIGAAFGIGFTFGPLLGFAALKLYRDNHAIVGYTAAVLSFVALLLGLWLLPETRRFEAASPLDRRWLNWSALRLALATTALAPVILTFFLATLGFGAFEVTLALLLKDALGFDEDNSFLVFAYVGFMLLLAQGFLYRRLARRVTEPTFIALGIVLMALGVGSLGGVSWLALPETSGAARVGYGTLLTLLLIALAVAVTGFAFFDAVGSGGWCRAHPGLAAGRDPRRQPVGVGAGAHSRTNFRADAVQADGFAPAAVCVRRGAAAVDAAAYAAHPQRLGSIYRFALDGASAKR